MYERLTKWEVEGCASVNGCSPIDKDMANAIDRLCDLEDKIEQGKILELPCEVGATLYFLYNRPHADKPMLTPKIYETNKWYFDADEKGISILPRDIHGYNGEYFYHLGKTVFLDRAEAEAKLREMEG